MEIMNLPTLFSDLAQNSQIKESNISEFLILKKTAMLPLRDLWNISEIRVNIAKFKVQCKFSFT